MDLREYIRQTGVDECAEAWGLSPFTIRSYRQGVRTPQPEQAKRIIAQTKGKIDWEGIYGPIESSA